MLSHHNLTLLARRYCNSHQKKLHGIVRLGALAAAMALSGCATIFEGTSQEITVNTNPPGATCVFTRNGTTIGAIQSTPALLSVEKRKYDIMITCNKPGYATASYLNHSGVSAAIAGNVAADILLTAGLSSIVDSADGADNKYDSAVNITLGAAQNPSAIALTPPPATAPGELQLMPAISTTTPPQ
jgi:hypothetical protein